MPPANSVNLRLAARLIARESRGSRGRLVFFVVCLALGVGAVTGVSALVSAFRHHLQGESRELLAADLKVISREPLPDDLEQLLEVLEPTAEATVLELATMLAGPPRGSDDRRSSRLVELKAADDGYPFYGLLQTDPPGLTINDLSDREVLVARELCDALELRAGDLVQLGGEDFSLRGELLSEPDRLEFGLNLGPRVLLSSAGLERTDLLAFGSRVSYGRLLRFDQRATPKDLAGHKQYLLDGLEQPERVRVHTHREAQPSVRRALTNMERYLGLVALLSLLLGGVGVAQVVRVWIEERTPAVAVLRSLGLRPREILQLYLVHVLVLASLASALGCAAGFLLPLAATRLAPDFIDLAAVFAHPLPVFARGFGLGLGIALVFAIGPLTAVYKVSPARVLRAQAAPLPVPGWVRGLTLLLLLGGIFTAAWMQADRRLVAAIFTGGLLLLVGLLVLGAQLAMWTATRVPRNSLGLTLRHGLAGLARPGAGTTATIVALGLGVHVIASLLLVEQRLSNELADGLPTDAPSLFLVDVQPAQWPDVQELLGRFDAEFVDSTPVAMARLTSIDGKSVHELAAQRAEEGGRVRWVLTREQRLTWRDSLPASNELVAGEWFKEDGVPEVSLEQRFAGDLGAEVGTRLTFNVQGVPMEFVVSSLRKVNWASFSINFFLIVEPGSLEGAPYTRLASARLETRHEQGLQDELVAESPNVTLLRLGPMLEKVGGLLRRIAQGVRALGWVAVCAGLAILCGAVASGGIRRRREVALLKTLGMTRMGVVTCLGVEYAMIGLVAGASGAGAAYALAWGFLKHQLKLSPELSWSWLPVFVVASALLAGGCGLLSSWRAIATRPALSLR